MKTNKIFTAGLLSLFAFSVFTFLVKKDVFVQLDFNTIVKIQDRVPRALDSLLAFFGFIGSFSMLSVVFLIILLFRKKWTGFFLFIPYIGGHVIELFLKKILHHPAPPFLFFRNRTSFVLPDLYAVPGSSYPSGHSLRAMFLGLVILFFLFTSQRLKAKRTILSIAVLSCSFLIILAKVVLGEHWPSDVVGGALLGAGLALSSLKNPIVKKF